MRPKILHVIKTLELGGAETNLRNLISAFDPEKFEHHVGYSFGGEIEEFFKKFPHVKLFRYSRGKHRMTSFHSILIMARIWFYIVTQRIRVVHTHNFNAHFWSVYAAKIAGAKVVEHVHDFRYFGVAELEKRKGVASLLHHINKFKGLSDRVVVLTGQNRKFLIENNFYPENKVRIIPNGIPIPEKVISTRKEVAEELGFAEKRPLVLVVSRMAPTKNIELVLRIASEVVRQVPGTLFLIAGNGEFLEKFKQDVVSKKLEENVRFIGYHADPARLLAACDVFLLPSFLELHSLSILEALSVGVPVVVSSGVGNHDEVFTQKKDALLYNPFSDEGWADGIASLLKDAPLRRMLGQNGRELCRKRFDILGTARAFEALYAELGAVPASC